ncbi:MAG: TlpA family protein disulfide reductase [Saprospiraceae bacterium]|nr:TlpA family protein disulfide reductase [Saprospiraceae bacterium]
MKYAYKQLFGITLSAVLFLGANDKTGVDPQHSFLQEVLKELAKIQSATYFSHSETWAPGDTVPQFSAHQYIESYNNPADTTIGVNWVCLDSADKGHLAFAYDGKMRAVVYDESQEIVIDSFKVRQLPFRPVRVPFYKYTEDIVKYTQNTQDSIAVELSEVGDTLYLKLTIHEDRQVEFFGRAYHMPLPPYTIGDPTSKYELWINKLTKLPFKVRRELSHNISVQTVSNPTFNLKENKDFTAAAYFPAKYKIRQYREKRRPEGPHQLLGKKAPAWLLADKNGEKIGLNDLDSKVVLVQFTSVNCGPCHASIPLLKRLSAQYDRSDFDLVAIESFNRNTNVLASYMSRYNFDYKFLLSEKGLNERYFINATPIFFILDQDRIVREVFRGYGGTATDQKITQAINKRL